VALLCASLAASAPGDPKRKLTPAGQAYAKAFVLKKADLPLPANWKATATDFSQANPPCLVKHYSYEAFTLVGEVGTTFAVSPGIPLVESDGSVFVSADQARRAALIDQKIGLARCVASALSAELEKGASGVTASVQTIERLTFSGLAGAYGFRIALQVRTPQGEGTIHATLVGIRRGRGLAALTFVTAAKPWPQAAVRSFAEKTASRMKTS
jgi:hypothetical protein